ncbi:hypothetical protein SAMN06296065_1321, partial [Novosphingobium panipatense]
HHARRACAGERAGILNRKTLVMSEGPPGGRSRQMRKSGAEALVRADVIEALFARFDAHLKSLGYLGRKLINRVELSALA